MVDDSPEPEKTRATRLVLEHLVSVGPEAGAWSSCILPCIGPPGPKSKTRAIGHVKTKRAYTQLFHALTSHPPPPNEPNNRTPPATMRTESRPEKGPLGGPMTDKQDLRQKRLARRRKVRTCRMRQKAGDKRRGARLQTCRVAIPGDMSLLGITSTPVSPRVSRPVSDKNKQNPTKTCHFVR